MGFMCFNMIYSTGDLMGFHGDLMGLNGGLWVNMNHIYIYYKNYIKLSYIVSFGGTVACFKVTTIEF